MGDHQLVWFLPILQAQELIFIVGISYICFLSRLLTFFFSLFSLVTNYLLEEQSVWRCLFMFSSLNYH